MLKEMMLYFQLQLHPQTVEYYQNAFFTIIGIRYFLVPQVCNANLKKISKVSFQNLLTKFLPPKAVLV